jgi:hypothetical protein
MLALLSFHSQEMLAIMKSIYDMMGRHTYPILREDAPLEHVERFFQVSEPRPWGRGAWQRKELLFCGPPWASHLPSLSLPTRTYNLAPHPG